MNVLGTIFVSGVIKYTIQTLSFHHKVIFWWEKTNISKEHIKHQIDIITLTMNKVVVGDKEGWGSHLSTAIMGGITEEMIFG